MAPPACTSPNLWALCLMYFCASLWLVFQHHLASGLSEGPARRDGGLARLLDGQFHDGCPVAVRLGGLPAGGLMTDCFHSPHRQPQVGPAPVRSLGHGVCAACYLLSVFAHNPWPFVLAIAFAAFWNDITMGSAWATCLDIGKRYSGIVSGCMNTVGNLGGFAAGFLTGTMLDWYSGPVKREAAGSVQRLSAR